MEITGPVRGDDLVRTRFSPDGVRCRGTLNNCANGYTPWGTYLTCEENWAGYFVNDDAAQPREHKRYGVSTSASHDRYSWHTRAEDEYARFNAAATGASALADYRNEPNTFGWVVEIDPMDPASTPKKRTALGRFAHEGAWPSLARFGQRLAIYMGDDSRFEYIYKFVTRDAYWGRKTDRDLLDHGTLYVARFNEDGSGDWLALEFGQNGLTPENGFHSQADILVNTRTAADFVGHMAEMSGLPKTEARQRAADVLYQVGLDEERYRLIGGFLTRMKKRGKRAPAVVHDPSPGFLDEPTAGLDPPGRDDMLQLVDRIYRMMGISVVLSSHILEDIERVCDYVVIINSGQLVLAQPIGGAPAEGAALSIQIDGDAAVFVQRLNALGIDDARQRERMTGLPEIVIRHPSDKVYDAVRDTAVALDVPLVSMTGRTRSLEDLYLQAVGAEMLDPEMLGVA